MKTFFYGNATLAPTKLKLKNMLLTLRTQQQPIGSSLKPEGHMGGGFADHTKGAPRGLALYHWAGANGESDGSVTIMQLDNLDVTPDNRSRFLGNVVLVREEWRRKQSQGGGEVVEFVLKCAVHDDEELLRFVRHNSKVAISLHPTQYELPAAEVKPPKKRKKDKHDYQRALDEAKPVRQGGEQACPDCKDGKLIVGDRDGQSILACDSCPHSTAAVDPLASVVPAGGQTATEKAAAVHAELQDAGATVVSMSERAASVRKRGKAPVE